MKPSERIRGMETWFRDGWQREGVRGRADEVALLEDACAGALNYLNGTATKFSERNKAAVRDKLKRALEVCTCNHSTFAGFHDADCLRFKE